MLDVTAPGSGNVATAFIGYTRAANRPTGGIVREDTVPQGRSDTERVAAHADATSACAVTN